MLACFPRLAVAPAVETWLAQAAGWHGIAAARDVGYGTMLAIRSIAGTKPEGVDEAVQEERDGWLLLPLDRDLAELAAEQEGLEIDDVAARAIDPPRARPPPPPQAELDIGLDPEGVEHFELWV